MKESREKIILFGKDAAKFKKLMNDRKIISSADLDKMKMNFDKLNKISKF